ncbi:MAG: hypothetical protein HDS18_03315 [Bacteroides sp.]|nr:hypothetical protein [Bacteroides sp.]
MEQNLLSQEDYERLEDALRDVMQHKRCNPLDIVYIFPGDKNVCLKWGENDWWISTYPAISNIPVIGTSEDNYDVSDDIEKYVSLVSDEESYVASLKEKICKEFDVDANLGWDLVVIDAEITSDLVLVVKAQNREKVKSLVDEYNLDAASKGYPVIVFDEERLIVSGSYKSKGVSGGFFEKRKIKKQNQAQETILKELINRISDIENA